MDEQQIIYTLITLATSLVGAIIRRIEKPRVKKKAVEEFLKNGATSQETINKLKKF